MRVCKCGEKLRQHELTNGREAWSCSGINGCGRYEVFTRPLLDAEIVEVLGDELDSSDEAFIKFARGIEAAHGIVS